MASIRIGIVGCGSIAEAHLRAYAAQPDVRISQVFDVNAAAAQRFADRMGARVATSVEEMATGGELDAVSICTPPGVHEEHCLPFIENGVAILCEKPLAADLRSAVRIRNAVVERQTLCMVGFCHRFHGPIRELKHLIDSGVLGQPLFFRNFFGGYLPLAQNHRNVRTMSGGGALIDNGCHSIDLFRHLVGEPTHISAATANVMQAVPVEDLGLLQLRVDTRCFGHITATYSLPAAVNSIEWHGTKGMAIVYYFENGPELKYRVQDNLEWQVIDCSALPDRFTAQIEHFVDCVRTGAQPNTTVEDGVRAAELVAAAYSAAESGAEKYVEACVNQMSQALI